MNRYLHSLITLVAVGINCACHGEVEETLALDLLSYEAFIEKGAKTLQQLKTALLEKGIVGIKGIPGYKEKLLALIAKAREFAALPEEVKQGYAPIQPLGETFLGYEMGKERFQRPDGRWVIDDSKASYYAFVPEDPRNK